MRGAFCGLVFGSSLSVFLLTVGVLPLDSVVVVVLPALLLLAGLLLGMSAPLRRSRAAPTE